MFQLFGIRHHGPGCARSLRYSLEDMEPDIILVEGPPDANTVIPFVTQDLMEPPVALLIYAPDCLQSVAYYPFTVFSPEWQALQYAMTHQIPVRFIDLPQKHQLAIQHQRASDDSATTTRIAHQSGGPPFDPLLWLAQADGYDDSERWWNHLVEQRQDHTNLFVGILEAMVTLRQEWEKTYPVDLDDERDRHQAIREAHMRKMIRQAQKEGFEAIAIVCGAWHTPALLEPFPPLKSDNALLKGLAKIKVSATWIPWSYGRLTLDSGYGAGIESPGWYHHLWQCYGLDEKARKTQQHCTLPHSTCINQDSKDHPQSSRSEAVNDEVLSREVVIPEATTFIPSQSLPPSQSSPSLIAVRWLTTIAHLLRHEGIDVSSSHVIEAVRLAETLAALRDRSLPGLPDLNEAAQTVLCSGEDGPMRLIRQKLIVSDRLGTVPDTIPVIPLQQDLQRLQKRLRLKPTAEKKSLTLDLRHDTDLARSHLLHQLSILGIDWGIPQTTTGKGTFKEGWILQWYPDLAIALIEAGQWGNTIVAATTAYVEDSLTQSLSLPDLIAWLDRVLKANLGGTLDTLMASLQTTAALSKDILTLMAALPPLAQVVRYQDIRQTNTSMVLQVADGIVTRICLGMGQTCRTLDDDAAKIMDIAIQQTHRAIKLLRIAAHTSMWHCVLTQLLNHNALHSRLSGCCCRILLDEGKISPDETARKLSLALSTGYDPAQSAAWVEGFLMGSGLLLLHDDQLWGILDQWVANLEEGTFITILPLLRRIFSRFTASELRQMGDRVTHNSLESNTSSSLSQNNPRDSNFNPDNGQRAAQTISYLLGLSH